VPNHSETWRDNTNSAELALLKFLLLAYHHSHSWSPPWISHLFHNGLLGGRTLFLQLGCFWIRYLCTCHFLVNQKNSFGHTLKGNLHFVIQQLIESYGSIFSHVIWINVVGIAKSYGFPDIYKAKFWLINS